VGWMVTSLWGAVFLMRPPLGEMGILRLSNEDAVVGAMKGATREHGLYFFPGMEVAENSRRRDSRFGKPNTLPVPQVSWSSTLKGKAPCRGCKQKWRADHYFPPADCFELLG